MTNYCSRCGEDVAIILNRDGKVECQKCHWKEGHTSQVPWPVLSHGRKSLGMGGYGGYVRRK